MGILNKNLTIEDATARLSLQRFDLAFYSEFISYAKKLKLDPTKDRIKVQTSGNRISIENVKDPLVVANTETLEIFYQSDKIPFSSKLSAHDNLVKIEQFFSAHRVTSALVLPEQNNRGQKIFDMTQSFLLESFLGQRASADSLAVQTAKSILISGMAYVGISSNFWISDADWKKAWPFTRENTNERFEFTCELDELMIKRGSESFGFKVDPNYSFLGRTQPAYKVSYSTLDIDPKKALSASRNFFMTSIEGRDPIGEDGVFIDSEGSGNQLQMKANPRFSHEQRDYLVKMAIALIGKSGEKNPCAFSGLAKREKEVILARLASAANSIKTENGRELLEKIDAEVKSQATPSR